MLHLIPIPIIFLAVIVYMVTDRYGLKIMKTISKIIIIVSVLAFIYFYLDSLGLDIIKDVKNFLNDMFSWFFNNLHY